MSSFSKQACITVERPYILTFFIFVVDFLVVLWLNQRREGGSSNRASLEYGRKNRMPSPFLLVRFALNVLGFEETDITLARRSQLLH